MTEPTDTNQASEDELRETVEKILRFNCPDGCDGNGSFPEMSADGEWEQGQCQWCFEYGMPAREAIQALIRTEKLKLLDRLESKAAYDPSGTSPLINPRAIEAERNNLKES